MEEFILATFMFSKYPNDQFQKLQKGRDC